MVSLAALGRPWFVLRNWVKRRQEAPAILHITHWKAGSQWIHKILHYCCPERVVPPAGAFQHLLREPVCPGRIYPTVYGTRGELQQVSLPRNVKRFIVIRDLRDTFISHFFSVKISHALPDNDRKRAALKDCDVESGLLYMIEQFYLHAATIQVSWLGAKDPLIRYEDLLLDDQAILERVLLDHCRLPVSRKLLRNAIRDNRFERLTTGRPRGQEDVTSHERKGIAGDWRNYFTEPVKAAFKRRFGYVLIATGYERDLKWQAGGLGQGCEDKSNPRANLW